MGVVQAVKNLVGLGEKPKKEKPSDFPHARMRAVVDKIFEDTKEDRDTMTRFLKRFKGDWWDKSKLKDTDSTVVANLFFSTVMTIAPLITDNRPIWAVRPRKPYLQNHFEGLSLGLEYAWDKLDLDMISLKWILDALVMKLGVVQVSFDADAEFGGENRVEVIDPREFFCAPGYDDNWDAPMQGTRIRKPISWIRTQYPETGANVKGDSETDKFPDDAEKWELENKYATVYTVWFRDDATETYFVKENERVGKDIEGAEKVSDPLYPNGHIVVFTKDGVLEDKASVYKHGKPPFVTLYDILVPHALVGMGECDQTEELIKSFNRSLQLMDRYTQNRCDPPGFIDSNIGIDIEQVKQEIRAGGALLAANLSALKDPSKPIVMGDIGQMDQIVPQSMAGLLKLHEEVSGITDVTKGMTSKSQRQSATEISTLIESAYTRTRQRVRNYEWSVKRLLYLLLCNMQQFYTEPRSFSLKRDNQVDYYTIGSSKAQVANTIRPPETPPGEEQSPEDAQAAADYAQFIEDFGDEDVVYADFDLEIQTNSSLPMDKQSLANLFLRLLEMAGANPVTGMPMWEAALTALRIPRYKEIIDKMQELFDKQTQVPAGPPGQGPEVNGPPGLMSMIQQATGAQPQGAQNVGPQ